MLAPAIFEVSMCSWQLLMGGMYALVFSPGSVDMVGVGGKKSGGIGKCDGRMASQCLSFTNH